jgi:hypothetical protein
MAMRGKKIKSVTTKETVRRINAVKIHTYVMLRTMVLRGLIVLAYINMFTSTNPNKTLWKKGSSNVAWTTLSI